MGGAACGRMWSTVASFSSPVCVCPHKPRQVTQIQAPLKPYHMSRTHNLLLLSASFESYQINQFSAGCAVLGFEGFLNLFGLSRVAVTTQQWRSALVIGGSPATVIQNILTLLQAPTLSLEWTLQHGYNLICFRFLHIAESEGHPVSGEKQRLREV